MAGDDSDIPLLGHAREPSRGENAQALLHEITALLKVLLESEETSSIDLRAIPLTPDDYALLQESLGEGEIEAEVAREEQGMTRLYQTGIAGVWWVTHYNEEEDVIGDFIEIGFCPEVLIADLEQVHEGLEALQARLLEQEYLTGRGGGGHGQRDK